MNELDLKWVATGADYLKICDEASKDDAVFANFRRHQWYTNILEHCNYQNGLEYLEVIKRDHPFLLKYFDKFKASEQFGNPRTYIYNSVILSPTTLRYIKVLSDLIKYHGNLDGFRIAEIGGGYGGQAKIISDVFKFRYYHLIDLPQANLLSRKFLNKCGVENVRFSAPDQLVKEEYDLVISNYAFTELLRNIQNHYYDMIISGSKRGYMTCNTQLNHMNAYMPEDYIAISPTIVFMKEEPVTNPDNFIVYWNE